MQPPPDRLAPYLLVCSRMHVHYVGDNVVFFRIDSIHSPGPKPVPLGREGTKIVASFFDGGF